MRSVGARHSFSDEKFNNSYDNDLRLIREAKIRPEQKELNTRSR